jgi:hypothetical protein
MRSSITTITPLPFACGDAAVRTATGLLAAASTPAAAAAKEAEALEAAAKATLRMALRVPSGTRGIAYEPEWVSASLGGGVQAVDLSTRHLLLLTNSASNANFAGHQQAGDAVDDALYKMRVPVVTEQAPGLTDNIIFLRVLGFNLFNPICMIPMGKHAVDSAIETTVE